MTIDPDLKEIVRNTLLINMINQAERFDTEVLQAYFILYIAPRY
jgi:hypothetical protein